MMKWNWFCWLLPLLMLPGEGRAETPALIRDGASDYVIAVAADAIPAERNAAQQLQHYLKEISGVELPVVNTVPAASPAIYVGQSPQVAAWLPAVDFAGLAADAVVLQTLEDGNLVVAGGRPRGTLYAVFTLLEESFGVRFWGPGEESVPRERELLLPSWNLVYTPPFAIREAHFLFRANQEHPEYTVQSKQNGHYLTLPPEWGGNVSSFGTGHTFELLLIPVARYFAAHPEWFSFNGTERVGGQTTGQLCLTNPEMKEELIRNALALLAGDAERRVFHISQNDNSNYCRCAACEAKAAELGGQTDLMMWFLNDVAARLAEVHPDVIVETLAYQYTRPAPTSVKPAPNVRIRLCFIEADISQPFTHPRNADMLYSLTGWSRIAPRLGTWIYVTNYANYIFPHPNWDGFPADLRLFRDNHVDAVFAEGDAGSGRVGNLVTMRSWVMQKLMWNPDLDADRLIREFMTGYYGAAAPKLEAMLTLLRETAAASPVTIPCYMPDSAQWLPLEVLRQCRELAGAAWDAVSGDPVLSRRVRLIAAELDYTWLWRREAEAAERALGSNVDAAELRELLDTVPELLLEYDPEAFWGQGAAPGELNAELRKRLALEDSEPLAGFPAWQPGDSVVLFKLADYEVIGNTRLIFYDGAWTSDGGLRIPGTHTERVIRSRPGTEWRDGAWELFVELKADRGADNAAAAVQIGVRTMAGVEVPVAIPAADLPRDEYRFVRIGEFAPGPGGVVFVDARQAPEVTNVYLRRMFAKQVK